MAWRREVPGLWAERSSSEESSKKTLFGFGWEPMPSGCGRRLTFWRSWVRIPVLYAGWTLLTFNSCNNGNVFFCKIYLLIIIQVQFIHQITHFVLITRTLIINILTGLEQVCRNVLVVIKSSWASSCFSNLEKTHLGYVYFTSNLVRPSWDDDLHCEDFVILLIFQL